MNDRLIAGLVAFAAILPMCALCLMGPAAIGAVVTWLGIWISGNGFWLAVALAAIAAVAIHLIARRRPRTWGRR